MGETPSTPPKNHWMKCSCTVCSCVSRYHFFLSNWSFKLVVDSPCGVNNRKKKLPLIEPPNLGTPPPKKRKIGRNDGTGEVILFIYYFEMSDIS